MLREQAAEVAGVDEWDSDRAAVPPEHADAIRRKAAGEQPCDIRDHLGVLGVEGDPQLL